MANAYTSPEAANVEKRRTGEKLTTFGVILGAAGLIGIVVSTVLKAVWLGILGGPIAGLSWLALIVGVVLFIVGFNQIKAARGNGA
jgi:vacuolar-type H+-ATPase subunit I/STV1